MDIWCLSLKYTQTWINKTKKKKPIELVYFKNCFKPTKILHINGVLNEPYVKLAVSHIGNKPDVLLVL